MAPTGKEAALDTIDPPDQSRREIEARVETFGRTGVEMEALMACAAAALTIWDSCRTLYPLAAINDLAVWEKRGGRSGTWSRGPETHEAALD